MKKTKLFFYCLFAISMLMVGCGITETTDESESFNATEQYEEPELITIIDIDDAWKTILNGSTRAFIGGHPIDEGFLSFVTATYGSEVVEQIAAFANFETPQVWFDLTGKSIHVLWYEYCNLTGIQNYSLENTYVYDSSSDDEIVLDFIGDFTLAEGVGTTTFMDQQINGILDCFSDTLITEMHSADIFMINNEFSYTNHTDPLPGKAYTFKTDAARAKLLYTLGVDIVNLANNHVYDYGQKGMQDTLAALDAIDMPYVGAGYNLEDAMQPVYFIVGGKKIAIVSATQIERTLDFTKEATASSAGVLKCLHPQRFAKVIKKAKSESDIVIAVVHWGTEGNSRYGADQISLARAFVEAGADVIVGGHTHCLQTVEYIDQVPVYYSLGNFFFTATAGMPNAYDTGIAQLRINRDGQIDSYFLPCRFENGVVTLLEEDSAESANIIERLNSLSETVVIESNGLITKQNFTE